MITEDELRLLCLSDEHLEVTLNVINELKIKRVARYQKIAKLYSILKELNEVKRELKAMGDDLFFIADFPAKWLEHHEVKEEMVQ